jgi:hypothetical protein
MAIIKESTEFGVCDVCGARWVHDTSNPARQCRNGKCKSRLWNVGPEAATMRAFWKSKNVGRPKGSVTAPALCQCGHPESDHTVTREEMGGMTIHNQCGKCGCYGFEQREK